MSMDDAAKITPPREGKITVTSLTAQSASGAVAIDAAAGQLISVGVDGGDETATDASEIEPTWWIKFGDSSVADPDPSDTAAAGGDGRCFGPYKGIADFRPLSDVTHYKVICTGSGTKYVRHYASSP